MLLLRLVASAVSALLVGCASGSNQTYVPQSSPYVARVETPAAQSTQVYSSLAYVPTATQEPAHVVAPAVEAPLGLSNQLTYPAVTAAPVYGAVAENGSFYGQPNVNGVPKTVEVSGYYRKDGTYVRGHYRSPPNSNPPSTRRRK